MFVLFLHRRHDDAVDDWDNDGDDDTLTTQLQSPIHV